MASIKIPTVILFCEHTVYVYLNIGQVSGMFFLLDRLFHFGKCSGLTGMCRENSV